MTEWIISSSVLITAVLILRRVLRGKLSPGIQYALWAIVLIRLLMPFSLFSSDLSIHNVQEQVSKHPEVQQIQQVIQAPIRPQTPAQNTPQPPSQPQQSLQHESQAQVPQQTPTVDEPTEAVPAMSLADLAVGLWIAGIAVMAMWLAWCNIRFSVRLKRTRREMECTRSLLPVYFSPVVETPCLFGLFHPAVYLTADAVEDATVLRYVLTHELTHYRQMDHLWAVLRAAALILHWYNPLVWIAFRASRQDCEMACDARTLTELGEEHRGNYGRTLVGLATGTRFRGTLVTATSMGGSKRAMKERIVILMKNPKTAMLTMVSLILVCALIVGCTFTGPAKPEEPTDPIMQFETLGELFTDRFNGTYEYTPEDRSGDAYEYIVTVLDSGISYHPLPDDGLFNFSESSLLLDWENAVSGVNGFWQDSDIMVQIGQPDGSFYIQLHNGTNANWIYISECDKYVPLKIDPDGMPYRNPADPINTQLALEYDYYLISGRHIEHYGNGDPETTVALFLESTRQCYYEVRNRSLSGQFDYADVDITGVTWAENENGSITVSGDIWLRPRAGQKAVYPHVGTWEEDGSIWFMFEEELIRLEDGNWYRDSDRDGVPNWEPEIIPTEPEETISPPGMESMDRTALTQEQLDLANEAFASVVRDVDGNIQVNPLNNFNTSYYSSPDEIDLYRFIYYFCYKGEFEGLDADFDRLAQKYPELENSRNGYNLTRYPADAVDEILYRYTGYHIEELYGTRDVEGVWYLAETDAYYSFSSDAGWGGLQFTGGSLYDGYAELYDHRGNVMTLVMRDGSYCIHSYLPHHWDTPAELTAYEIDQVNKAFASTTKTETIYGTSVEATPVNCFFTCYYEDPTQIDLKEFLRHFTWQPLLANAYEQVTEEEFDHIRELEGFWFPDQENLTDMYVPIHKYPAHLVDYVLQYYTGVSLDALVDVNGNGDAFYSEKYDAYYNHTSDFAPGMFHCIGGVNYGDIVELYSEDSVLILQHDIDGHYCITAHLPLEHHETHEGGHHHD